MDDAFGIFAFAFGFWLWVLALAMPPATPPQRGIKAVTATVSAALPVGRGFSPTAVLAAYAAGGFLL